MAKLEAKPEALAAAAVRIGNGKPERTLLEKFGEELGRRYPNRMIKRFVFPTKIREAREVFVMELTSREEVDAAIMAESTMSQVERASIRLANDAERRELTRKSIVGVGELREKNVVYHHANHDGIPFVEIDRWSPGAWTCLHAYHGTVNGVPTDELRAGIEAAQNVGAFALPQTSEAPESDSTGK